MTGIRSFFSGKFVLGIGGLLLISVSVFLLLVPVTQEPGAYETFYIAVEQFKNGLSPYENYGFDHYKYSPTFLFIPLYLMSFMPLISGGIVWQGLSLAIYYLGMFKLVGQLKLVSKPTVVFSVLFIFYALSDLNINGTHGQSNTLLVGFMVLSLAFYFKRQFFWAALSLAFVTNMKIIPIALTLLLFLDFNKRFISWSVVLHLLLLLFPFLIWGVPDGLSLYSDWLKDLLMDKKLAFETVVHFYLSVRPFLEANFGFVWGETYFAFVLVNALIVALGVFRLKLRQSASTPFSKVHLLLIFNISLLFILLFNPRTEGPSIVLMAPVYVISLWWIFNCLTGGQKTKAMWFLFLMFMLISQSTSDLFRGTIIQTLSWDHNLRTLGILAMYVAHVWLLFKMPSALHQDDSQLFVQPEKEKEGMST